MDNDWHECINIDQHLCTMTIKANIAHFFSNALLSCNAIITVVYLLGDYVIRFAFLNENYNNTVRQLPIKMQFPFEIEQSPIFELISVIIFLYTILQVWTNTILNGLIFSLVTHIVYFLFSIFHTIKRFIELMIIYINVYA